MSDPAFKTITESEVESVVKDQAAARALSCKTPFSVAIEALASILNGEYPLHEARSDYMSFRKDVT